MPSSLSLAPAPLPSHSASLLPSVDHSSFTHPLLPPPLHPRTDLIPLTSPSLSQHLAFPFPTAPPSQPLPPPLVTFAFPASQPPENQPPPLATAQTLAHELATNVDQMGELTRRWEASFDASLKPVLKKLQKPLNRPDIGWLTHDMANDKY